MITAFKTTLFRVFLLVFLSFSAFGQETFVFTTDSLVEDAGKLPPEVAFFLNPAGPLNRQVGVIGSMGTVGKFSPFGSEPWNATSVMRSVGNWEALQESLTKMGGPLSESGPYVIMTKFGQNFIDLFSTTFPGTPITNLFASLRSGSPLHLLGDAGPLGALSIMGPGGPNGASGFGQTDEGAFINRSGEVVNSIFVNTRDGNWLAPLYELYDNTQSKAFESPDSFFAVDSKVTRSKPVQTLSFTNNRDQVISVLLISDYTLDDFELVLRPKGSNKAIATTNNQVLSNFIVFKAPAATDFEVDVRLKHSYHMLPNKSFRVLVTGSSEKATQFKGPHQRPYNPKVLKFNKQVLKSKHLQNQTCYALMRALL